MFNIVKIMFPCITVCFASLLNPSVVRAEESVTYEVSSDQIKMANIEYMETFGRIFLRDVPLPWRTDVMVRAVRDAPPTGSQVRADWRPAARPSKWVTVRVLYRGEVLCESTLDIGNATCYGNTPHFSSRR